ncbi:MAG TPA: S41 family peptidase [Chthoniobacterales bacterium]
MKPLLPALAALLLPALAIAQTPSPSAPPAPSASPTATPVPEPTPEPLSTGEIINALSDSQLDQAIQSLRTNFLDAGRTTDRELRRATLEGLIDRLSPGLSITTETAVKPGAAPAFLAEILDDRIGYLRLGSLGREALAQMDAALANFKAKGLDAVVLDLRGAPASSDYEVAADVAKRFCAKGKLLFSIQKPSAKQERILTSDRDPDFSGILVVLTDKDNAGAAEALAATLRKNANAMIVGTTTRGEAVEFSDVSLGEGKILRVAVAQIVLPDSGPIFPDGVKPDIAAALSPATQGKIFALSKEKGVSSFVFEMERPHLNEAALVANTNPEIDPAVVRSNGRDALWDTVLQRAVDLVTAISFYDQRAR